MPEYCVITKLDGENSNLYNDYFHARSMENETHPSRHWVKSLWGRIAYNIPIGYRICGENLYAKHTISYENLKSYFYVFSIWDEKNNCLSWDDTLEWCELLELEHVPVIYRGIYDEKLIREAWKQQDGQEGYVIRLAESFSYGRQV